MLKIFIKTSAHPYSMGYIQDVFDMFLLRDEAYKKVGNDKNGLNKFVGAFLLSEYLTLFFIFALLGIFIFAFSRTDILPVEITDNLPVFAVILFFVYLFLPFVALICILFLSWISHLIGLLVGGKPLSYLDFVKVANYTYPAALPLIALVRVLSPIYTVWSFFMLYKTYRIIHKLSPRNAGIAIVLNVCLVLFVILVFVGLYAFLISLAPEQFLGPQIYD